MTPPEQHASRPCNLCGSQQTSLLSNRSRSGGPLRTVICVECGLVWSDPFPHDPRSFYESDYRISYKGTYSPQPKHVLRAGEVAVSRYRKMQGLLRAPRAVLDVGTAGGEFAYLLQTLGHEMHGVEPNKGYAEYSMREYGLKVQSGFIQEAVFANDAFDVITLWHVLEHTEDPYAVLVKLRTLLKPTGVLVIEVPNIEATCQSPRSTFHEAHLFNFNVSTLSKLAEKASLVEQERFLSVDGGNITMLVRKAPASAKARTFAIPGNSERIASTVRRHTSCRHFLSAHPYARLYRRVVRSLQEKRDTRDFQGGKQLLDALYRPLVRPHAAGDGVDVTLTG